MGLILHLLNFTVLPTSNYLLLGRKKFIRHFNVEFYFQSGFVLISHTLSSFFLHIVTVAGAEVHCVPVCLHLHTCFLVESYV